MKKQQPGFTIIEVLLAMSILISSVFVLSDLQIRSIFRVMSDREQVDRIFLVKKDLYAVYLDQDKASKPLINKIENPNITITTKTVDIVEKSELRTMKKKIHIIQSVGEWKSGPSSRQLIMVALVLKPEEEDKKS